MNRRGVSCLDELCPFLEQHSADFVALPEADVPEFSSVGFCNAWMARGMHASLSAPEDGKCRVALLSSFPAKSIVLSRAEGATRHAAVLVDLKNAQGNVETFLVVAVYGQAGDEATAADQIEDILQMAMHSGFRFLLLGDFNLVPAHPMLLDYLADGTVIACDECQPGEQLPPTGPVYKGHRRRRIDFGLSHFQWPALDVIHLNGPSDHLVVGYSLDAEAPLLRIGPVRRCLKPSDMLQNLDVEFAQWDASPFESTCAAGDLDEAWRLLSNVAEDLVCVPDASAIPRIARLKGPDAWVRDLRGLRASGRCSSFKPGSGSASVARMMFRSGKAFVGHLRVSGLLSLSCPTSLSLMLPLPSLSMLLLPPTLSRRSRRPRLDGFAGPRTTLGLPGHT